MHIIRGSGLKGLRGMKFSTPLPGNADITLIRPLLEVRRSELEQYCKENDLEPRHDATNDDTIYQRNYIRHEILPRLQELNPNVVSALSRLGEISEIEDEYVVLQFEKVVVPHIKKSQRRWTIALDVFRQLHEALQRRYFIEAFLDLTESPVSLNTQQVVECVSWVNGARGRNPIRFGSGIRLRMGYDSLYMEDATVPIDHGDYRLIPADTEIMLDKPSTVVLNDIQIQLSLEELSLNDFETRIILPEALMLVLRTRRAGDRFRPIGMQGHSRKLKDWMIDRKIPRPIRDQIPIITANGEIIAICIGSTWHLADLSQLFVNSNLTINLILD